MLAHSRVLLCTLNLKSRDLMDGNEIWCTQARMLISRIACAPSINLSSLPCLLALNPALLEPNYCPLPAAIFYSCFE